MLLRPAGLALFTALALGAPAALAAPASTPVAEVRSAPASAPAPADASDTASYAHRERQSKHAADYQGGSFIVIGISGVGLLVLLLALLLI